MGNTDSESDRPVATRQAEFDLVVFDCDGVLIDSEVLSCSCLSTFLCEQGYQVDLQDVFDRFLGRGFSVVEEQCRAALGRQLEPGFADAFRAVLKERFARDLRPMPGIETLLASLRTPCCVASSSDRDRLSFSLAIAKLATHFGDRVYSSDLVARAKPAPDLFLYAAERMQSEPSRTLVIEDSVNGVRAGKAAGMTVWGFIGGSHYAGRDGAGMLTEAGADRIVRDMADLPPM
jgi:HAD superfamily hydrolase (TIGR01509 family)